MLVKEKEDIDIKQDKSWENQSKEGFTEDDIIDAFLSGKASQKKEENERIMKKLNDNLSKAKLLTEEVFYALKANNIESIETRLSVVDIFNYNALIIVPEENYISDEFKKIYNLTFQKKKENNSEDFHLSFYFMPKAEKMNEDSLIHDFPWSYNYNAS